MRLRLHAPAKVNLGLRVVGRRDDGYHLLDTIFHAVDLHDTLWLDDSASLGLEVVGDGGGLPVPAGDDNLVLRAARMFFAATSMQAAGAFRLRKSIPAGGGLGGGSSDAAATLLLLQHRHGHPLAPQQLMALAVALGADVPFFLQGGTQRGTGIGEVLHPVAGVAALTFVLIVPAFGTSTAAVFKNYRAELTHARPIGNVSSVNPSVRRELWASTELSTRWHNDLEASAEQLYPDLARLRQLVSACGYPAVSMSGSGATLFLSFAEHAAAAQARARLLGLGGLAARVLLVQSADGMVASRIPSADDGALVPAPPDRGG